jgi:hypothetical protein
MVQTKVIARKTGNKNGKASTLKKVTSFTSKKPVRKGKHPTASTLVHIKCDSVLDNALAVNSNKVEIQYNSDGDLFDPQQNFYKNSSAFQSDDDSVDLNAYCVPSRRGAGTAWKSTPGFCPNLIPLV